MQRRVFARWVFADPREILHGLEAVQDDAISRLVRGGRIPNTPQNIFASGAAPDPRMSSSMPLCPLSQELYGRRVALVSEEKEKQR